ncbi:MAG: glycosyltransferase family 39 protein [Candidatus Rokubacteria bacterium]|nr:glycosyltransferase family 39 protein [Candidatus Rokubacteria bacterium]
MRRARALAGACVAVAWLAIAAVAAVWLARDHRPPEWDYANHLERVVHCAQDLARADLTTVLRRSSFYPPAVPCTAAIVYRLAPSDVGAAQVVILGFLALGMAATCSIARRLAGETAGVVAAALFGSAPFVVELTLRFQLDVPLAALVALMLAVALKTEGFRRPGWSLAAGVVFGLGMLTKPPFPVYVLAPLALLAWQGRSRRGLVNVALASVVAAAIALPWYGPRLIGLPLQVANRSYRQANEAGLPEPFTSTALAYYPVNLVPQFGAVAAALLVLGLAVAVARRSWFVLAALAPWVLFFVIQNKNLRYTVPLLPAAAVTAAMGFAALPRWGRAAVAVVMVAVAAVQVGMTTFARPAHAHVPGLGVPLAFATPPLPERWPHREILDLITRDSGGGPVTVSVVPNAMYFSAANFRYYGLRDGRAVKVARAWDGEPIGIDYMIVKTGEQGPAWTAGKPRRIDERLATDAPLARAYPVIGLFPLPDGSTAAVRARRVGARLEAGVGDVAPDALARALEEAVRQRLPEVARDVDGLAVRVEGDAAIARGEVRRLEIAAVSATIGELKRRDTTPLRLHDLRVVLEGLLVNPYSLAGGRFDPLDMRVFRLEQATITENDLRAFVQGQKGFQGASLRLDGDAVDVRLPAPGLTITARARFAARRDDLFGLVAERVAVGGVPVPHVLVDWVVRNFDPSVPLAQRLPVRVEIGRIAVVPGAIRITWEPGRAEEGRR